MASVFVGLNVISHYLAQADKTIYILRSRKENNDAIKGAFTH